MTILKNNNLKQSDDLVKTIKQDILNNLLNILAGLGLPIMIIAVIEAIQFGQAIAIFIYISLYLPILTAAIFKRNIRYDYAVFLMLFGLYVMGVFNIYTYGFSGAAIPLFLTIFVLTTTFLGYEKGFISIVICSIPMIIIGYLMVDGQLSPGVNLLEITSQTIAWITALSVLILFGAIIVLSYGIIHERLMKLLETTNQQKKELARINEDLEIAKNQAEESNELKTAFLRNISHEIKTPLNGIIGFSQVISSNNNDNQNEECVHLIKSSGDRLISMIDNIMEISLIETGQIKVNKQLISVQEICEDLYSIHRNDASKKEIKIIPKYNNSDLSKSQIFSDRVKLNNILDLLITNAVKFTDKGTVSIDYELTTKYHKFSIEDSGIGINSNQLQNIFNIFEQVDGSRSRVYEGVGIGLSIAKGLTDILNGRIEVESKLGVGSIFSVILPVDEAEFAGLHDQT